MANEVRGNIVTCPNCGATVEAGSGKCGTCGYVFTNMKANSTAQEFARQLDERLSMKGRAKGNINEFIKNFPLPSGKEEMIEFIASMHARSQDKESQYAEAYRSKMIECLNKSKIVFAGDPQIKAIIKQTESSERKSSIINKIKSVLGWALVSLFFLCGFAFWYLEEKENDRVAEEITSQFNELSAKIDELPIPTAENHQECAYKIEQIVWTPISITGREADTKEIRELQNSTEQKLEDKKDAYRKLIRSAKREADKEEMPRSTDDIEDEIDDMMDEINDFVEDEI